MVCIQGVCTQLLVVRHHCSLACTVNYVVVLMQEDKLEPSEQLGDLLKQAGDADAALKCYRSSGATTKVIEGELSQQTTVLSCHDTQGSHLVQPNDSHACLECCMLVAFALLLPPCSSATLTELHESMSSQH